MLLIEAGRLKAGLFWAESIWWVVGWTIGWCGDWGGGKACTLPLSTEKPLQSETTPCLSLPSFLHCHNVTKHAVAHFHLSTLSTNLQTQSITCLIAFFLGKKASKTCFLRPIIGKLRCFKYVFSYKFCIIWNHHHVVSCIFSGSIWPASLWCILPSLRISSHISNSMPWISGIPAMDLWSI